MVVKIINGKHYKVLRIIGSGAVGKVFEAIDIRSGEKVAVKLERAKKPGEGLVKEYQMYQVIQDGDGIPIIKDFEEKEEYNVMVMELLGHSLTSKLKYCSSQFSLRTVLLLADQMLRRLEFIHSKNIIHRDIKTDNFIFGTGNDRNRLYLIDFDLSKKYRDENQQHIQNILRKGFIGNLLNASVNTHRKYEPTRRDDLEAVGYLLIKLLIGSLPWESIQCNTINKLFIEFGKEKLRVYETLKDCVPEPFLKYIKLCRSLTFSEDPPYSKLRQIFRDLYNKQNYEDADIYDWDIMDSDTTHTSE